MRAGGEMRITRRRFGVTTAGATASVLFESCGIASSAREAEPRLSARPQPDVATIAATGPLGLDADRDAVLQLPSAPASGKIPLLVFLHGATQRATRMIERIGPAAAQAGIALLAPDSRETTWDAIRGRFGDDVVFLNRALERVFARVEVDPDRMAIGGFSDGATYALSLGLANGDLFPRVLAFSPGFVISAEPRGRPQVYISHGMRDQILPIDRCSRVIVPRLRSLGYDVTFREFDGRHEMPTEIVADALRWIG
jgi:phospholipase/carboxylesterase